jgi:hypothetical protein
MSLNLLNQLDRGTKTPTIDRQIDTNKFYQISGNTVNYPYDEFGRARNGSVMGVPPPIYHQRTNNSTYTTDYIEPRPLKSYGMQFDGLPDIAPPLAPMVPPTNTEIEAKLNTYNDGVQVAKFDSLLNRERVEQFRAQEVRREVAKQYAKTHDVPVPPEHEEQVSEEVLLLRQIAQSLKKKSESLTPPSPLPITEVLSRPGQMDELLPERFSAQQMGSAAFVTRVAEEKVDLDDLYLQSLPLVYSQPDSLRRLIDIYLLRNDPSITSGRALDIARRQLLGVRSQRDETAVLRELIDEQEADPTGREILEFLVAMDL